MNYLRLFIPYLAINFVIIAGISALGSTKAKNNIGRYTTVGDGYIVSDSTNNQNCFIFNLEQNKNEDLKKCFMKYEESEKFGIHKVLNNSSVVFIYKESNNSNSKAVEKNTLAIAHFKPPYGVEIISDDIGSPNEMSLLKKEKELETYELIYRSQGSFESGSIKHIVLTTNSFKIESTDSKQSELQVNNKPSGFWGKDLRIYKIQNGFITEDSAKLNSVHIYSHYVGYSPKETSFPMQNPILKNADQSIFIFNTSGAPKINSGEQCSFYGELSISGVHLLDDYCYIGASDKSNIGWYSKKVYDPEYDYSDSEIEPTYSVGLMKLKKNGKLKESEPMFKGKILHTAVSKNKKFTWLYFKGRVEVLSEGPKDYTQDWIQKESFAINTKPILIGTLILISNTDHKIQKILFNANSQLEFSSMEVSPVDEEAILVPPYFLGDYMVYINKLGSITMKGYSGFLKEVEKENRFGINTSGIVVESENDLLIISPGANLRRNYNVGQDLTYDVLSYSKKDLKAKPTIIYSGMVGDLLPLSNKCVLISGYKTFSDPDKNSFMYGKIQRGQDIQLIYNLSTGKSTHPPFVDSRERILYIRNNKVYFPGTTSVDLEAIDLPEDCK